jgi:hypothetical protein
MKHMKQDLDKTIRIPVITELVRAGDPAIVNQARNPQARQQRKALFEQRLKERIAELQAVTGQDEYAGKLGRAHAIRSEQNKQATPTVMAEPSFEKHLDNARSELIRELASLLK